MIFGKLPISPEKLVTDLQIRASKIANKLDPILQRNTAWTIAIVEALHKMVPRGCRQITRPQFILDIVWWQDAPKESGSAARLGVECEWGNPFDRNSKSRAECVVYDFEKLLQFKAPMKLMIFQADNAEMRKAIHNMLLEYLQAFGQHVAGETYVFMEFASGHCFSYKCEILRDGLDRSLNLKPMTSESAQILKAA
jgi:hypothetical protein